MTPAADRAAHWAREQTVLGPGISQAVQWAGLVVTRAEGAHLWDADGRRITDLMGGAGVNLIGHSHPDFVRALTAQMSEWMIGAHASNARLEMTEQFADLLPARLGRIQLYSGGSEAVEAAVRLAKAATGKFEVLSFWNAFHGRTAGSLALTGGARKGLGPTGPGTMSVPFANCYRCPLRQTHPGCGFACVEFARDTLRQQSSGALAAILVEPVQGRAGNVVPPPGYLSALRGLADEYDALLIADESMTGMGRTGALLACDHERVGPDVVVLGKGIGAGYPVSAVLASTALMTSGPFGEPSANSSSYGGFPTACRAVAAVTRIISDGHLAERAAELGERALDVLLERLRGVALVGEVRGKGLAIGIELVADRKTRTPIGKEDLHAVFDQLLAAGVLVMTGGNNLRLYPPLTVGEDDLLGAVETIADVLRRHEKA
ncbi:aspartate aminotransferase family protein [Streptomyces sp. NPDC008313]|uniref:aspartate aminotransferase family protein n=1 Tax=Streptomyces sp. NPDC008313 TaxID=3364826 RepID=UPI0036EC6E5F